MHVSLVHGVVCMCMSWGMCVYIFGMWSVCMYTFVDCIVCVYDEPVCVCGYGYVVYILCVCMMDWQV